MFDEPFSDGGRHGVVEEDLPPVFEGLVGGQDHGSDLGSFGGDLEEEITALLVERQVPELVDDEQFFGSEPFKELSKTVVGL